MRCPECGYLESKVVDSRPSEDGSAVRRRRECLECGVRFTTYERIEEHAVIVIKSDGSSEAYDRNKLYRGLLIACAKRPVSRVQIDEIVDDIEVELRVSGKSEIRSKELGTMALRRLESVDEVAFVRFASVYHDFQSAQEFAKALEGVKHD